MNNQVTKTLQLLMPPNETTLTLGDKICVTDNMNLFFGTQAQAMDCFPLQLSAKCMLIVLKGNVSFRMNFRDYVAADSTCVVLSRGTIVERMDMAPDAQVIQVCYALDNVPSVSGIFLLQPHQVDLLKTTFGLLRDVMTDSAIAAGREDAACKCVELMESIVKACDNRQLSPEKPSRQEEIVTMFMREVQENYRKNRDVSFYADRLGLSLKYMSRVVFDQTGRHPSQWIKDHVILEAKTMLRSGRYSVQQVADALNFPNQSFFGKYFKEAVGVSPKKCR